MKNLKIKPTLLLAFAIVIFCFSTAIIMNIVLMRSTYTKYSVVLENYRFSQGDVGLLVAELNDSCTNVLLMIASKDPSQQANIDQAIVQNKANVQSYIEAVRRTIISAEEAACMNAIEENMPQFYEHMDEVLALGKQNRNQAALAVYSAEAIEHIDLAKAGAQKLMDLNRNLGATLSRELTATNVRTVWIMIVCLVLIILSSIALSLYVSGWISKAMGASSDSIYKLSGGDLSSPMPEFDTKDESGILAKTTKDLVGSLSTVVRDMTKE